MISGQKATSLSSPEGAPSYQASNASNSSDLAATLRCRSSYARRGLLLGGGFVDPGFRGQLTLCLVNMGADAIPLAQGDRVVQMILHEVSGGAHTYKGRYQDSEGVVRAR